jgi:hypothetical protein
MTDRDANALVAVLVAAFPHPLVPNATMALYATQLAQCKDAAVMAEVVQAAIENEERLPSISVLLREYRSRRKRKADQLASARGLDEARASDAENERQARMLYERLRDSIESPAFEWNGHDDVAVDPPRDEGAP